MSNFVIRDTPIEGVKLGEIQHKADERGYFERVYCHREYELLTGRVLNIKQINRSMSKVKGTTRGLHFQWPPRAETKIVSCAVGRLYDVAVDLRVGSTTFLKYFAAELTAENKQFLVIPEGIGHGFQTLEQNTEILYLVTEEFSVQHDDGINPVDPMIGVDWPLEIAVRSKKDEERIFISDRHFTGIVLPQTINIS
jgi:dTDP-4-dehydrorhamnose 3,5-epimerase